MSTIPTKISLFP